MKVLLASKYLSPSTGGTQVVIDRLREALEAAGLTIAILGLDRHAHSGGSGDRAAGWYKYLSSQIELRRRAREYQVVHVFHPSFGLGAVQGRPQALIVSLMGDDTYNFKEKSVFNRLVIRRVMERADVVTAPSRHMAELAREIVDRQIEIIPHGVEPRPAADKTRIEKVRKEHELEGSRVFLVAQRLHPTKDTGTILRAWRGSGAHHDPEIRLVILGDGQEKQYLMDWTDRESLTNVLWLGDRPASEVNTWIDLCDVFVHHSKYEAFGLGVAEALSRGKLVIAAACGAIPEVVDEAGFVYPPGDDERLSELISSARSNQGTPSRKPSVGAWSEIAARYIDIYERLSNQKLSKVGKS